MNNQKTDNAVIRILDLKELSRVICSTDKGYLTLKLRKGETNYWLHLDSVPLGKEENTELMALLYPVKEREIPQVNVANADKMPVILIDTPSKKKKGGRPKGSKSKK